MRQAILALLTAAVTASAPGGAHAQDAAPAAEADPAERAPTFRRIAAPGPGHTGPRITIQIEPGDNFMFPDPDAPAERPVPEVIAEMPAEAPAGWFWSRIDPALPADAARFWAAEALLTDTPPAEAQAVTPRLAHVAAIARDHGRDLLGATVGTQVSPAFALAVIAVESAGRIDAVSHAGAQGLMQLIPATADRFGVADPFDPGQNIRGGVAYLDWLMQEFDRDPVLVLAAYNAGEGAVRRSGGVPDYEETRNYVPKVLAAWQVARSLCLTPPELVSDGCVFRPIATQ
jgi:soluble lytic murein transglycosylase-like protein